MPLRLVPTSLRLFAPADNAAYVLATSATEPACVVDRKTGSARLASPAELVTLIGPSERRARSIKVEGLVGLLTYPDERGMLVVTEVSARTVATEHGAASAAAIAKVLWLPLTPFSENAEEKGQWQPPSGSEQKAEEEQKADKGQKQRQYLKEFLEAGDMYVSHVGGDLTHTLQRRAAQRGAGGEGGEGGAASLGDPDERFVWNRIALSPLTEAGRGPWVTPILQAAILTEQIYLPAGGVLTVSLISRRSCEHAGTRFKTRGLNDGGAAANFVETEQVLHLSTQRGSAASAYVVLRGSVPVFWEQKGRTSLNPKPRVTRAVELTAPALRGHLESLTKIYGGHLLLLSLLDEKGDETELASALSQCVSAVGNDSVLLSTFDFHAHTKGGSQHRADGVRALLSKLAATEREAWRPAWLGFYAAVASNPAHSRGQLGVIRVNCLDCLNRTNMAQTVLALQSASEQLRGLCRACELPGVDATLATGKIEATLHAALRKLWTETGDMISLQYTGTSNLSKGSNITGEAARKSLMERASGLVEKGVKTAQRYVHENFLEDTKQVAIDALLGGGQRGMLRELSRERARSSSLLEGGARPPISIVVGTWNVNGKVASQDDLMTWLGEIATPLPTSPQQQPPPQPAPPGVYIVGFQEFVDLNAQNLLRDDGGRRKECRARLEACLQSMHGEKYVEVGVEQMFGVFLLVYVRAAIAGLVGGVCHVEVRTGFGSDSLGVKAGNKGGVAVRLDVNGASLCIINSHLPAGQSHPEERNATYGEVLKGLAAGFAGHVRGGPYPAPLSHDLLIWLGDLNYRVERPNDEVRRLIAAGEWSPLLQNDQLKTAQRDGLAFEDFVEAPIKFQPTYKYDAGTSVYDTSEKARTPSWTDRVLWRPKHGSVQALAYTCSQRITCSDHKPVAALLLWSPDDTATVGAASPLSTPDASPIQLPTVDLLSGFGTASPASPSAASAASAAAAPVNSLIDDLDSLIVASPQLMPQTPTVAAATVAAAADITDGAGVGAVPPSNLSDPFAAAFGTSPPPPLANSPPPAAAAAGAVPLFASDDLFGSSSCFGVGMDSTSMCGGGGVGSASPSPTAWMPTPQPQPPAPTPAQTPALLQPMAPMQPAACAAAGGGALSGSSAAPGGPPMGSACAASSTPGALPSSAPPRPTNPDEAFAFDDLGIGNLLATSGSKRL